MRPHDPSIAGLSRALLGALVLIGLVLCIAITAPFVPALTWSVTLAVLFAPVEAMLRRRLRYPSLSVSLTLMLAALVVVLPILVVIRALVEAIMVNADGIGGLLENDLHDTVQGIPGGAALLAWLEGHFDLTGLAQSFLEQARDLGQRVLVWSVAGVVNLLLTFYFLFYLLRDRAWMMDRMAGILPLGSGEFVQFAQRLQHTILATVWGTLAVSAIQGLLGGLMFWWLGLPSPVLWGIIMGLLAIVPFLGAFVIWVPFAIYLATDGQYLAAAVLTVWGTLIVGLIDNIIYPVLVGYQLALHSMISFIAIIGGIAVFGAHGFVLGPLALSATISLSEILRRRLATPANPPAENEAHFSLN